MKAASHLLALRSLSQNGWILSISFELALRNRALSLLCTPSQTPRSLTLLCSLFYPLILRASFPADPPKFPWVLASSIVSSLAFIFAPILEQASLNYATPWPPVAAASEDWLQCLLPCFHYFLISSFIVKSVHSWNLHTCSRKHCW